MQKFWGKFQRNSKNNNGRNAVRQWYWTSEIHTVFKVQYSDELATEIKAKYDKKRNWNN